ncbi:MAG: hypothetical protein RLZZ555_1925, partial [Pseudomonadota bacterium]
SLAATDVMATSLAPPAVGWRIRTRTAVNEPVVSLSLRVGCQASLGRSYALLADQDESPVVAVARFRQAHAVESSYRDASHGLEAAPVQLARPRPRPPGVERLPSKVKPVPVQASSPAQPPAPPGREPRQSADQAWQGPRLELELLEHGSGMDSRAAVNGLAAPVPAVVAAPAYAGQKRPKAGHADGSAAPQPGSELEALRAEQVRTREQIESLQARLAQSRWQDPVVLVLLGLCSASLLALAWTLLGSRRQRWA